MKHRSTPPSRLARAALLALVLGLCAACQSTPEGRWVEGELPVASQRLLWQVTSVALEKAGFPSGVQSDSSATTMTSGWDVSLAPFKGDGWREQAIVRFEPASEGRWKVGVRVVHESNENLTRPLDAAQADWKARDDNEERARIVLQNMRSLVAPPLEVGPDKRRRGGA